MWRKPSRGGGGLGRGETLTDTVVHSLSPFHLFCKVWRDVRTYQAELFALHQIGVHGYGGVWLSALWIYLVVLRHVDTKAIVQEIWRGRSEAEPRVNPITRPPATLRTWNGGQSSMTKTLHFTHVQQPVYLFRTNSGRKNAKRML